MINQFKSCPILFQASMVQAILDGQKTKTRRGLEVDIEGLPIRSKIKVGDFLWVREAWQAHCDMDHLKPSLIPSGSDIIYNADRQDMPWISRKRPSIFMPKWALRITLEVTGVKVQRLDDISEAEAIAEGATARESTARYKISGQFDWSMDWSNIGKHSKFFNKRLEQSDVCLGSARNAFANYWESINGAGSWDLNP